MVFFFDLIGDPEKDRLGEDVFKRLMNWDEDD